MKRTVLVSTFHLILFPTLLFAAKQESTPDMVALLQRLNAAGYQQLQQISYARKGYKIEAYDSQCQKVKFSLQEKTLTIPQKQPTNSGLSMLQVAQLLQKSGYHNIQKIELKRDYYQVTVLDEKKQMGKLQVNAANGEFIQDIPGVHES